MSCWRYCLTLSTYMLVLQAFRMQELWGHISFHWNFRGNPISEAVCGVVPVNVTSLKKGHDEAVRVDIKLPWRLRKLEMPGKLNAWWGSQGSQKMKGCFVNTLFTPLPQSLCYVFLEWHLSLKHPKECPVCGTRISGMRWCQRSPEVLDQIWIP
jgi:hypothetical protein